MGKDQKRKPDLSKAILQQITTDLGLTLTCEDEAESEVCFANTPGLRPGFKQTFTSADLQNYIYAVSHIPACYLKHQDLLNTKDAFTFWSLVEAGTQARQLNRQVKPQENSK